MGILEGWHVKLQVLEELKSAKHSWISGRKDFIGIFYMSLRCHLIRAKDAAEVILKNILRLTPAVTLVTVCSSPIIF